MTQWNRRRFVTGLGLATLAAACKRAERTKETGAAPTTTTMHYEPADPGYSLSDGPAPFSFDGDELLEIRDGILIRRNAALAEIARYPLEGVTSFAVLRDRSLVVLVEPAAGARLVHHVVAGRTVATYDPTGKLLASTEKPTEIWEVDGRGVSRGRFGSGSTAGILVPIASYLLPDNTLPGFAALSDGSIAIANVTAILHADATTLTSYAWTGAGRHLGPGPEARLLWASDGLEKVALVKLEGTAAAAIATHPVKPGETIVHLAGFGDHAAAVIARPAPPSGGRAEFMLAVYDTHGERWRVALDSERAIFYVALSATRVVVRSQPAYTLRAWDLATGKPD